MLERADAQRPRGQRVATAATRRLAEEQCLGVHDAAALIDAAGPARANDQLADVQLGGVIDEDQPSGASDPVVVGAHLEPHELADVGGECHGGPRAPGRDRQRVARLAAGVDPVAPVVDPRISRTLTERELEGLEGLVEDDPPGDLGQSLGVGGRDVGGSPQIGRVVACHRGEDDTAGEIASKLAGVGAVAGVQP